MQKLNQRRLDSRVCVLKNMVGADEVDDDLQQEITGSILFLSSLFLCIEHVVEECSKYGEVIKVVIYTEQQGEDDQAEQIVKIFVEFRMSKGNCCHRIHVRCSFRSDAEKTVESLNGRWFAARMIKAELYDQTAYQADDLSG